MALQLHPGLAVHPGVWLHAEIVQPCGLSVTALAGKLGVTRQAMSNLLNGRSGISAEMALRFEKAFGLNASTLLRMQAAHDMAAVRAHEKQIRVQRIASVPQAECCAA
jgi:addiction module HigA family antidote